MHRRPRAMSLVIVLIATAAILAPTTTATSGPTPITISTQVSFVGSPQGTFVVAAQLFATGTFVDAIVTAGGAPSGFPFSVLAERTLTCDDGSGSFFIQLHAQFLPNGEPGTAGGSWTAIGGTDAYSDLRGAGTFVVTFSPDSPSGTETLTGFVVLA
jgi:hypothetical protein